MPKTSQNVEQQKPNDYFNSFKCHKKSKTLKKRQSWICNSEFIDSINIALILIIQNSIIPISRALKNAQAKLKATQQQAQAEVSVVICLHTTRS